MFPGIGRPLRKNMKAKSIFAVCAVFAAGVLVVYKTTSALVLDRAAVAEKQRLTALKAAEQQEAGKSGTVRNLQKTIENLIPGHFVQITFSNVDPKAPLDQKSIYRAFEQECAATNANECVLAVYDQGKKPGDGIRAWSYREKQRKSTDVFLEARSADAGKVIESWLGYFVTIGEIYEAYSEDEFGTNAALDNIPLIFSLNVQKVGLDSWGEPYIETMPDRAGHPAARLFFDVRDPIFKKIHKDSRIVANCVSAGLSEGQALMECYMVQSDEYMRSGDNTATYADIVQNLQFLK